MQINMGSSRAVKVFRLQITNNLDCTGAILINVYPASAAIAATSLSRACQKRVGIAALIDVNILPCEFYIR